MYFVIYSATPKNTFPQAVAILRGCFWPVFNATWLSKVFTISAIIPVTSQKAMKDQCGSSFCVQFPADNLKFGI